MGILLLFLQFQTFFTFTPILEESSCNFLTFLLMFCFLNDESLLKILVCCFIITVFSPTLIITRISTKLF